MGTKHYTFRSYEDDVDAGQYVKYEVDPSEFKIDEDCIINSAAYISKEGEVVVVSSARGQPEGNFIACDVPIEIKTGEYKLKVSVVSLSKPENTAIIESYAYISINGKEDVDSPPKIETVHFTLHQGVIPVADLTGDTLAITGKHLRHVTGIKIQSPPIFFNITFHDNEYIKAKAISVPRVQGLRLVYPVFEYTILNKKGEFVSSGEIRSSIPLRIQGD
jgi:hypothetical protein